MKTEHIAPDNRALSTSAGHWMHPSHKGRVEFFLLWSFSVSSLSSPTTYIYIIFLLLFKLCPSISNLPTANTVPPCFRTQQSYSQVVYNLGLHHLLPCASLTPLRLFLLFSNSLETPLWDSPRIPTLPNL